MYLHVDVTNAGALALYERAGFQKVAVSDEAYQEFTKSLNLHDGATRGRCHYLMYKDLLKSTVQLPPPHTPLC